MSLELHEEEQCMLPFKLCMIAACRNTFNARVPKIVWQYTRLSCMVAYSRKCGLDKQMKFVIISWLTELECKT